MTNTLKTLYFFVMMLSLASCGSYDQLIRSKDYEAKYYGALEYYEKGKYSKCSNLLTSVNQVFNGSEKADTITFYLGKCAYNRSSYEESAYIFDAFRKSFTRSPFVEEAEFLYAMSNYNEAPSEELDQVPTLTALGAFAEFTSRYPDTKLMPVIDSLVFNLQSRIYNKSLDICKTYYNIGAYNSAITALKNALKENPNSPHRERMMYMVVSSNYLFARNSISSKQRERYYNTIDAAYNFQEEYDSTSPYYEEVRRILANSEKLSKGQKLIELLGDEGQLTEKEILKGANHYEKMFVKVEEGKITSEEAEKLNKEYVEKLEERAARRAKAFGNSGKEITSATKGQNSTEIGSKAKGEDSEGKERVEQINAENIKKRESENKK